MSDLATSLEDHLEHATAPADLGGGERFFINDESSAEWAARKLSRAQARLTEINDLASEQIHRINDWADDVRKDPDRDVEFFTSLLTDWLRKVRQDNPDTKSIKLPSATIKSRAGRTTVEVADEQAFIEWALLNDEWLVTTKRTANKRALGECPATDDGHIVHEDTGEAIPGVGVVHGQTSYTVEVTK